MHHPDWRRLRDSAAESLWNVAPSPDSRSCRMPRSRRWTLMLVPEGCDEPRTWSLSERLVKRTLITGAMLTSALLLVAGAALGRVVQHQASGIIGSAFSG